jgi:hypothetical protein
MVIQRGSSKNIVFNKVIKNKKYKKLETKIIEEQKMGYMEGRKIMSDQKINLIVSLLKKKPLNRETLQRETKIPFGTLQDLTRKLRMTGIIKIIRCPRCDENNKLYTLIKPATHMQHVVSSPQ